MIKHLINIQLFNKKTLEVGGFIEGDLQEIYTHENTLVIKNKEDWFKIQEFRKIKNFAIVENKFLDNDLDNESLEQSQTSELKSGDIAIITQEEHPWKSLFITVVKIKDNFILGYSTAVINNVVKNIPIKLNFDDVVKVGQLPIKHKRESNEIL